MLHLAAKPCAVNCMEPVNHLNVCLRNLVATVFESQQCSSSFPTNVTSIHLSRYFEVSDSAVGDIEFSVCGCGDLTVVDIQFKCRYGNVHI